MARSASDEQVCDRSERESAGEAVGGDEASRTIALAIETAMAVGTPGSKFAKEPSRGGIGTAAWAAASRGCGKVEVGEARSVRIRCSRGSVQGETDGVRRHAEP